MGKQKFRIKDENIYIYAHELDPNFDYDALSEDERKALEEENDRFEKNRTPGIVAQGVFSVCGCTLNDIRTRAMNNEGSPTNALNTLGPFVTQEDIDQKIGVYIVDAERGKYTRVNMFFTCCKKCHELKFYGDFDPIAKFLNKLYMQDRLEERRDNMVQTQDQKVSPDMGVNVTEKAAQLDNPEFVMENISTGEVSDATQIIKNLGEVRDDVSQVIKNLIGSN